MFKKARIANSVIAYSCALLTLSACQYFPFEKDDPWRNRLGTIITTEGPTSFTKKINYIDDSSGYPWRYNLQNIIYKQIQSSLDNKDIKTKIRKLKELGMYCGYFNSAKIECRYKIPFYDDKSLEEEAIYNTPIYLLYISVYPEIGIDSLRFYRTYPVRTEKRWKNEVLNDMKKGDLL